MPSLQECPSHLHHLLESESLKLSLIFIILHGNFQLAHCTSMYSTQEVILSLSLGWVYCLHYNKCSQQYHAIIKSLISASCIVCSFFAFFFFLLLASNAITVRKNPWKFQSQDTINAFGCVNLVIIFFLISHSFAHFDMLSTCMSFFQCMDSIVLTQVSTKVANPGICYMTMTLSSLSCESNR